MISRDGSGDGIVICGLGGVTPVGRDAWSSAAAVRAGVSGFAQHPLMADVEGRPVLVAACPWLIPDAAAADRISDTLIHAVGEAAGPLAPAASGAAAGPSVSLLVNLPLPRPGLPDDLVARVQVDVQRSLAGRFTSIALAQRGHAGVLMALKSGVAMLVAGKVDACIVAGADSYLDLETLEWLEETEQLHGAGARNNAWGFVPGEGAGAVLLARQDAAERLGLEVLGRIAAVGIDVEKNLIRTESVCLGHGLTGAFADVFARLSEGLRVTDTYCDMNGEPYRADEYGFAVTRTRQHFVSPSDVVAPADCWGDVGAASAALGLMLALVAFRKSYANGDLALVWAGSDTGERGAALVLGG